MAIVAALAATERVHAVNIVIDYSYDTSNYFGVGNPDGAAAGAAARASIEEAADYFSGILDDTLSPIQTPANYFSAVSSGVATWRWDLNFVHPNTGALQTVTNATFAPDEFRVYVGGRPIASTAIAAGGPGGWSVPAPQSVGTFSPSEIDEINSIHDAFVSSVSRRGEPTGEFARWGGAIRFDTSAGVNWHWNHTATPGSSETDFFSVALHELAHTLGFGASDEWNNLVSGGTFFGLQARAANGGSYPNVTGGHWTEGATSTVFGTSIPQEVSLDPQSERGRRIFITTLDAAGLSDIGWDVSTPASPFQPGDYNLDGAVGAADFTIWRDSLSTGQVIGSYAEWRANYGQTSGAGFAAGAPEPAGRMILLAGLLATSRTSPHRLTASRRRRLPSQRASPSACR